MSVKFVCGCVYHSKSWCLHLCDAHQHFFSGTYQNINIQLYGVIKDDRKRQQDDRVDGRTEDSA